MDACPEDLALCIKETALRDLESVGNEADLYRLARSLYMINHVGLCKLVLDLSWTLCGCVDSFSQRAGEFNASTNNQRS
ncbi:hypothetical protein PoB_001371700 [Plakobranchus ocellatus]|uniref:Uncharacterized protein n=1 Tax=Plakobranchus ocellatus TaxID=259542 RepID=A0AAV3YW57_9GAST|nr:hypothetical protein PoB_001371700 [Plakobranchus ocellatus]